MCPIKNHVKSCKQHTTLVYDNLTIQNRLVPTHSMRLRNPRKINKVYACQKGYQKIQSDPKHIGDLGVFLVR